MASEELLRYVEESLAKGHSRTSVIASLERAGWPRHEIDSAFGLVRTADARVPAYGGGGHAGGAGTGHHAKFFNLQEGERILYETRPLKGLMWYMAVLGFFPILLILFFLGQIFISGAIAIVLLSAMNSSGASTLPVFILTAVIVLVLVIVVDLVVARRRYNMRYYWITDKRIIVKRGFIGYSINSIPLERISDVLISRSFVERIFGFGSLHIQSLAGQYSMRGRMGAEGNLEAIPDPEKNQEVIFRLVKEKRKTEHLTM